MPARPELLTRLQELAGLFAPEPLDVALARSLRGLLAKEELQVAGGIGSRPAVHVHLPLVELRERASDLLEARSRLARLADRQKYSAELKNEALPSFETEAPVRVTVYYGDEAQPIKDGKVREPSEKDKVWFRLENVTDETYGVVLKVIGPQAAIAAAIKSEPPKG